MSQLCNAISLGRVKQESILITSVRKNASDTILLNWRWCTMRVVRRSQIVMYARYFEEWGEVMSKYILGSSVVIGALTLSGCASLYEPEARVVDITPNTRITGTSSITHTFIRDDKSNYITCAMPPPDAAFNQSEAGDISLSLVDLGDGADSGDESDNSAEVEMAGRTPTVLLSRELFFRTCEFSQNYDLTKEEALVLYNKILDTIKANWAIEARSTKVTIGDKMETTNKVGVTEDAKTPTTNNTND